MTQAAIEDLLARDAVRDLIQRTARHLDNEELDAWIELFAEDSQYEITAYGPEIQATMSWWKTGREELRKMLVEVPQHVRDPGRRLHLVTPVAVDVAGDRASALSHFGVLRTNQDGASNLYAAGRYEDKFIHSGGRWRYEIHKVVLDTRMLEVFTHLPL